MLARDNSKCHSFGIEKRSVYMVAYTGNLQISITSLNLCRDS